MTAVVIILAILFFASAYSAVAWFLGGLVTGLIFLEDAPVDHKVTWFISGNVCAILIALAMIFS